VAGVCSLADIVPAVAIRAQGLQDLPPSGLLAVSATRAQVEPLLPKGTWIAVVTGPRQLVVAGWPRPLAEATATLERAGLSCRPVAADRGGTGSDADQRLAPAPDGDQRPAPAAAHPGAPAERALGPDPVRAGRAGHRLDGGARCRLGRSGRSGRRRPGLRPRL